ncbi:hypothetical protein BHM03_00022471 [Ensete ventricosum]|nr:hypothetical protein BHM03_00022471 [Ensete ventricosum]
MQVKIHVIIQVLQAHSGQLVSHQLFEEMKKLHISSPPQSQNAATVGATVSEGISNDTESEANTYFHQMFSGQLSIEAMVQMLARYKESSDKRSFATLSICGPPAIGRLIMVGFRSFSSCIDLVSLDMGLIDRYCLVVDGLCIGILSD